MIAKKQRRSFFRKHKEDIKQITICTINITALGCIIGGVLTHIINPFISVVSIPLLIQLIMTVIIKKSPKSIDALRRVLGEILDDEDTNTEAKEKFIDEVVSKYTNKTQRTMTNEQNEQNEQNEPVEPTPKTPTEIEQYNAYYNKKTNIVNLTPRYNK